MSSTVLRRKQIDKNEKDDKKKSVINNKLSTIDRDGKKQTVAKASEKINTKKIIENDKGTVSKVSLATGNKKVNNSLSKNQNVPLKANHHINLRQQKQINKDEVKSTVKKSVQKDRKSTENVKNTLIHTNVTVNSPKHKRKEYGSDVQIVQENFIPLSGENSLRKDKKFDITLNNHKRYRTRTLDPEEIKVVDKLVKNIEYVDDETKTTERKFVAQPKTFFVSFDDDENLHKKIIEKPTLPKEENDVQDKSDESVNYEDDFDSYESDFESCGSSDKSDSDNKSSISNSDSSIEDISSTTSGLSSLNNVNKIKINENDLLKLKKPNELLPPSLTSLTDEGFDENSSGLASSMNTIPSITKIDDRHTKSTQRASDLKGLIILDDVKYNLFEFFPMNYDTFITIYGKSNMNQVMCQTNDDYVNQDVQTESTSVETKWSQFPIKYSNQTIPYKNDEIKQEYRSPLSIYLNQKKGCESDILYSYKEMREKMTDRVNFIKLTKFGNKTAKFVLNYLNERKRLIENNEVKSSNDDSLHVIKNYPLEKLFFNPSNGNIVLSLHLNVEKDTNLLRDSLICIWFMSTSSVEPMKILVSKGKITCCSLNGGINGLLVAGLHDGNIAMWNLKESDMWFKSLPYSNYEDTEKETIFRICSYHSGFDICKSGQKRQSWGRCVDILFAKSMYNDDLDNFNRTQQVYLLHEFGMLTIWIVVHKVSAYKNISNMDHYHTQWSTVSLVKTNTVDLNYLTYPNVDNFSEGVKRQKYNRYIDHKSRKMDKKYGVETSMNSKKGITTAFSDESPDLQFDIDMEDNVIMVDKMEVENKMESLVNDWENNIVCSMMREHHFTKCILTVCRNRYIYNYSMNGVKKGVNFYYCEDEGSFVTCLEMCPSDFPHFFVSCSSKVVHLYTNRSSKPMRNFYFDQSIIDVKRFTEVSFNSINLVSIFKNDSPKNGFWLDWLVTSPGVFLIYSGDGKAILWDFFNSDVSPKLCFDYNEKSEERQRLIDAKIISTLKHDGASTKNMILILHFSDGNVQIHKINGDLFKSKFKNKDEELIILKKYFELLHT